MSRNLAPQLLAEAEARLARVHERIERACASAGRSPSEITLVGACKRQPVDRIAAAVCAGLRELGENYVQAAETARPLLEKRLGEHFGEAPAPCPGWRMIGHLQRNKAAAAAKVFSAVDTVDTGRLARALAGRAEALGGIMEVCLQVNLTGEPSKSGCSEENLSELLADCLGLPGLRLVGLMTLPPADPEAARSAFARLRDLRDTLSKTPGARTLRHLNMGMSGDLEVAIEEGATVVRVGTDLFGERSDASRERPAKAT